jgi:transposase-like protein
MKKSNKFSPEVRERAVRMVREHRGEYPSLWAAIESNTPNIGWVPQTLNEWVKRRASHPAQALMHVARSDTVASRTCRPREGRGHHRRVHRGAARNGVNR